MNNVRYISDYHNRKALEALDKLTNQRVDFDGVPPERTSDAIWKHIYERLCGWSPPDDGDAA